MIIVEVIWTKFALSSLSKIYEYSKFNAGRNIANEIKDELIDVSIQLKEHPLSGAEEEHLAKLKQGHRYLVKDKFKVIYKISNDILYITDVFGARQNPEKIRRRNQ